MTALSPSEILPLPQDLTLEEMAVWYAEHYEEIKAIRSFLYMTSRRLTEYVREGGPIATPYGLLQIIPEGWIWNTEEVKRILPDIVTGGKVTFESEQQEKIERAMSLVLEEIPELAEQMVVEWSVDKRAAANAIKAGGEMGDMLAEARTPDGSLGVR